MSSDAHKGGVMGTRALGARQQRILSQRDLEVRVQTPEGDNLAAKLGANQVAVTEPGGRVTCFCGLVDDESLEDAALFAAAPHLYTAVVELHEAVKALEGPQHPALKVAEDAIGRALMQVGSGAAS